MLQKILLDGTLFSLALSVLVMGSLYYNPRLWLQDYPKPIQDRVPPLNDSEKRLRIAVALPMFLIMLGGPFYSTHLLKIANGGTISFLDAWLNTWLLLQFFNLFDAVVLDFLILSRMKPKFSIIPGAEGLEYLYDDWGMQIRNFLKGIVICTVLSLPIALVAVVL